MSGWVFAQFGETERNWKENCGVHWYASCAPCGGLAFGLRLGGQVAGVEGTLRGTVVYEPDMPSLSSPLYYVITALCISLANPFPKPAYIFWRD